MEYYCEWEEGTLRDVKKTVLKTLDYLCKNPGRDGDNAFTSQQLDDVKDSVKILHMIDDMDDDTPDEAEMRRRHAAHMAATQRAS